MRRIGRPSIRILGVPKYVFRDAQLTSKYVFSDFQITYLGRGSASSLQGLCIAVLLRLFGFSMLAHLSAAIAAGLERRFYGDSLKKGRPNDV